MRGAIAERRPDDEGARGRGLSRRAAPAAAADPWDAIDLTGSLNTVTTRVAAEAERRKILRTLKENNGDRARTADVLQVGYRTLLVRMKELGIEEK